MKKRWLALCLAVVMLVSVTACQKAKEDDTKPHNQTTQSTVQPSDNVIPGTGTLDGESYSIRVLNAPAMHVYQIFGLSDGWVNIYGTYNEKTGFFYVNEKGEILNDTVYKMAYPFENGSAYVTPDETLWYSIGVNGAVIHEYDTNSYADKSSLGYDMVTSDGEERWFVTYNGEAITDPIFEWISAVSFADDNYAVLAEGEHRNVLINGDGEVTVVLPDDCTFAQQGENSIIGYFKDADGNTCFGLLGSDGSILSDYRYAALTHISNWLAVGILDDRLVLLDEFGVPLMTFDLPLTDDVDENLTTVAFHNDLIAAIGADNNLILLQVVFEDTPVRRRALEMVEKAQEIFYFYLSSDTEYEVDYANPTQGVDWLYEGTTAIYNGKSLILPGDYLRFAGEVMGQQVDSLESLRKAVETVLTPEAAEKRYFSNEDTSPAFVEYDGHLFRAAADGGYLPRLDRGSVKILSQSETSVEFTIEDYCNVKGDGDTAYFQMLKTEDGWRLNTPFPGEATA